MQPIITAYIQAIVRKYTITRDEAFEVLSAAIVLDKPFNEVHTDIWVGQGDDCGFDAIYIDDQTRVISLFQSKNSSSLKENELMKFLTDFDDLFVGDNRSKRKINPRMQAWVDEYRDMTRQGVVLTPKLFFVYSGLDSDPAHAGNAPLAAHFTTRGAAPEYTVIDSADLVTRISNLQRTRRDRVEFTFQPEETNILTYSRQALYSFSIGQVTGASFRISALHLCELIQREIDVNGFMDTLFTENVRGYLGKNKANKRMLNTLRDSMKSPFFPFLNNGLTVICDSVSIPSVPQVNQYNIPVVNPVIVNGLQTTRVIFDIFNEDASLLDGVYVTIKVYESRNQELTEMITESTNTQTSINYKDQMSNKDFNERASVFFAAEGIKFVSKRGEMLRNDDLTEGLRDSVNNELVLKFWYATFHKNPRVAKVSKNSLLENIFMATKGEHTDPSINQLFNGQADSPLYLQMYLAYRIQKVVTENRLTLGANPNLDYLLHSDELMAYGVFLELERSAKLQRPTDLEIASAYEIAQSHIQDIVAAEQVRRGVTYSHTRYFKSDSAVQDYDQSI